MKKLHLDKIKLSEMNSDEQQNLQGGGGLEPEPPGSAPSITVVGTVIVISASASCVHCNPTVRNCFSNNPGTADSCGLCNTHYMCPNP